MANVMTSIRIICALALTFCSISSTWFYVFYILGGISDVLDGAVARYLGTETKFGANFDAVADIIFTVIVIMKVVQTIDIPVWMIIWIVCIAVTKGINIISGFVIYKRFISEHTVLNKISGVILFVIPLYICSFSWQPITVLLILICMIASFAAVQEGYYICRGQEIR